MSRTEILDAMREVAYAIDYYIDKSEHIKNMIKKYTGLFLLDVVEFYQKRIQAQERLVRILEIRFEKLKQQL
jgi:hypothetical protein